MTRSRPLVGLSVVAIVIAIAALVAGERKGSYVVDVDLRQLATAIDSETDHLSVRETEEMLTSGGGIVVIDLRDSVSFMSSHIPEAQRSTVAGILDLDLERGRPILLYSLGGIHAAQAWMLLKAAGHNEVFTLRGGWRAWEQAHMEKPVPAVPAPIRKKVKPEPKEEEKLPWEC